jgi:hypothetical protein
VARVYLETSFVSACVTTRQDLASRYRLEESLAWWRTQSRQHELLVSAEVIRELSSPAYPTRDRALEFVAGIPLLAMDEEVQGLARILIREKVMPAPVAGDAIHVAVACWHEVDYLLSWNVKHLANPRKIGHLGTICLRLGLVPPRILTPDLLWQEEDEG